ncbi:hypothetical protein ACFFIF_06590 [Vagococcus entomophilus]
MSPKDKDALFLDLALNNPVVKETWKQPSLEIETFYKESTLTLHPTNKK